MGKLIVQWQINACSIVEPILDVEGLLIVLKPVVKLYALKRSARARRLLKFSRLHLDM